MTLNHYRRFSNYFLASSIVLFAISIVSTVFIIIAEFPLKLSLNPQGFENFFSYFSFPMKALTATLATFAVWLTLERLLQTEKQTYAIMDNNQFNNYTKHQQEFVDFMKDVSVLISGICEIEKISPRVYLVPAYKTYFAKTYEEYHHHMNEGARLTIDKFYHEVAKSLIGEKHCDLANVPINEITKISSTASGDVRELIIPLTEKVLSRIQLEYSRLNMPAQQIQLAKDRFTELHVISSTLAFYRSLLAFDGEFGKDSGSFQDNFEQYENGLGV
jgi:hypothetical protein